MSIGPEGIKIITWNNRWDQIFQKGIPSDLIKPYDKFGLVLENLKKSGSQRVLDIAVGAGRHSTLMASKGMEVVGFDLSETALELTRAEMEKRSFKPNLAKADMFGTYPYASNTFDGVVAIQAIYHGYKEHMLRAFGEVRRVLRSGGIFAFTVSTDRERAAKGVVAAKFDLVAPNTYMPQEGREIGVPHFYPGLDELTEMMADKFRDIDIIVDSENQYYLVSCKNQK